MNKEISKGRKITGWVLAGLIVALMIMSAFAKISGSEELVTNFTKWGLIDWLTIIGIGELAAAIIYLIPRTSSLGVLLLSAQWGGAIVTHMSNGESFIFQSIILVMVWVTAWVRNPGTFSSFYKEQVL
jgi:hypothetical protein